MFDDIVTSSVCREKVKTMVMKVLSEERDKELEASDVSYLDKIPLSSTVAQPMRNVLGNSLVIWTHIDLNFAHPELKLH